jgi:hypothetical protein
MSSKMGRSGREGVAFPCCCDEWGLSVAWEHDRMR